MPLRKFSFLPDGLLEDANAIADHWVAHGFKVTVDKALTAAPSVPALHAKRHKTEMVGLVGEAVDISRVREWCAYAKSTGRDFRVVNIIPRRVALTTAELDFMRSEGVGLLRNNGGSTIEEIAPRDLGLNVGLPPIISLPAALQRHLGSAFEQFERSHWREGFEDACQAIETLAREYLVAEVRKGRVTQFITKKTAKPATIKTVQKKSLGQLAVAFTEIPNQNRTDAQLAKILKKINRDRVGVAHYKHSSRTETRLRKNVGMHMWTIVGGMKLLV